MPRPLAAVPLLALALLASACAGAPDTAASLQQVLRSSWAQRYAGKPGGLTLVVVTPDGSWFASTVPGATPDSHFRAASTTKTFTAAAIMLLDQRGQLRIEDPVAAAIPGRTEPYLPDTPDFAIPYRGSITIQMLLEHRAGVFDLNNDPVPPTVGPPWDGPDWWGATWLRWRKDQSPAHTFTIGEMAGFVAANGLLNRAPGIAYHYSDTGYALLAAIVERVSGMPIDRFLQREFLAPLGLAGTRFVVDGTDQALDAPGLPGFSLAGGEAYAAGDFNLSYDVGSGNAVTTPSDLARWFRTLLRGEAGVSAAQVARMETCLPTGIGDATYGLGLSHGYPWLGYGHNGGVQGYFTMARHDPATGVTVLLLSTLIDFDDSHAQADWMAATATEARRVAGF